MEKLKNEGHTLGEDQWIEGGRLGGSVIFSALLHGVTLTILLSMPVPQEPKPMNLALYQNIIVREVPEIRVMREKKEEEKKKEPPPPKPKPKPKPKKVEKEKEPEPAPAPVKTSPTPTPPKPMARPEKPKTNNKPIAVSNDADADAPTVEAPNDYDPDAGAIKGERRNYGYVGGKGDPNSTGTSLTSNGAGGSGGGVKKINIKKLRADYLQKLIPRVKREYFYPNIARRLGLEGRVLVALTIGPDGRILNIKIYKPSAHDELNNAAKEALGHISQLPKPPAPLLKDGTMRVIVPMVYSLN